MPWVRDKRHMLEVPEGDKVQYSIEQVRTAFANAKGIARTALSSKSTMLLLPFQDEKQPPVSLLRLELSRSIFAVLEAQR